MLCFESYPQHIATLIEAALTAVDPDTAVRRHLRRDHDRLTIGRDQAGALSHYQLGQGRIFVVAAGKAAVAMAAAAAEILGDALTAGIVITKRMDERQPASFRSNDNLPPSCPVYYAGHPVPDEEGVQATAVVIDMLQATTAVDLVLFLISGGASALLTQPLIPLPAWQQLTQALLTAGCTIQEMNQVRRRLDQVKGGGLARQAEPATCVSLILSDVVGNPLHLIGSGPTVADPAQPADTLALLKRYQVLDRLPEASRQMIDDVVSGTEKQETPFSRQGLNLIVGDVRLAAEAAVATATELGFSSRLLTTYLEGEASEVGLVAAALAKEAVTQGDGPSCLIFGGETTVTLRGSGVGGRNQEVALAAAIALDGWERVVLAAFATDGDDGPSGAAGAVITGATASQARSQSLDPYDYLARNDSFTFFQQVDGLLETGPTGTNVNDLLFILTYPSEG